MIGGLSGINPATLGSGLGGGLGTPAPSAAGAADAAGSFATLLSRAAEQTIDSLSTAEQASVQAMQGQTDTRTVVDAVMNAEQSLQAAIAIRDKIVAAYLEVSRMAI
ncbi:MAG: flagellar hook-basal body complex protein FliE [Rhizobiaceae bacterium]|nr:flagellar hook-basal body complex protein FliE [Rhizobiaceae bacterium]